MLRSLVDFARDLRLVSAPGFSEQKVDYKLMIGKRSWGLIPTAGESQVPEKIVLPTIPKRGTALAPGFTFDNSGYALGVTDNRPEKKLEAFLNEFKSIVDEGVAAVLNFYNSQGLADAAAELRRLVDTTKSAPTIALYYDDELLVDRPAVRAYYDSLQVQGEATGRCLVTGLPCVPKRTHRSLKLPKSAAGGCTLVSFNGEAFSSHGKEQGDNAPISEEAMVGYTTALNWLIDYDHVRKRRRYGVALNETSMLVFWTKTLEFADLVVESLDDYGDSESSSSKIKAEADLKSAVETAERFRTGSSIDVFQNKTDRFHAAVLSSAQGRAVVRNYSDSTVGDVARSLSRWRQSFGVTPMGSIVDELGLHGSDLKYMTEAALFGRPLPRKFLFRAVASYRSTRSDKDYKTNRFWKNIKSRPTTREVAKRMVEYMLGNNETNSYRLGRLFAVIEEVQRAALGAVESSVADKHLSRCMTNPGLVFPGLLKLSKHHEKKIDGAWAKFKKLGVLETITEFPSRLTLEQQGEFILGYSHECAYKGKAKNVDREVAGAPEDRATEDFNTQTK